MPYFLLLTLYTRCRSSADESETRNSRTTEERSEDTYVFVYTTTCSTPGKLQLNGKNLISSPRSRCHPRNATPCTSSSRVNKLCLCAIAIVTARSQGARRRPLASWPTSTSASCSVFRCSVLLQAGKGVLGCVANSHSGWMGARAIQAENPRLMATSRQTLGAAGEIPFSLQSQSGFPFFVIFQQCERVSRNMYFYCYSFGCIACK